MQLKYVVPMSLPDGYMALCGKEAEIGTYIVTVKQACLFGIMVKNTVQYSLQTPLHTATETHHG